MSKLELVLKKLRVSSSAEAQRTADLEAARDKLRERISRTGVGAKRAAGLKDPVRATTDANDRAALDGAELELLVRETAASSDRDKELIAWLNQVRDPDELLKRVTQDPVNVANGSRPLDRKDALAILRKRQSLEDRAFRDIADLGAVARNHVADLRHTLTADRLGGAVTRNQSHRLPILMPVRLETRFVSGAEGRWTLKLLIVPDTPWFDAHNPAASSVELDALEQWQQTVHDTGGRSSPGASASWSRLVTAVGGGRAVWLARTFPVVGVNPEGRVILERPSFTTRDGRFNTVRDFPRSVDVYLGRGGAAPARVARLRVLTERILVDLPVSGSPAEQARWWESFDEAKTIGLAVEIDLGARADDIDVLYVVGVGDGDPRGVFESHRNSGRLGLIPSGTPTNAVNGRPAAGAKIPDGAWLDTLDASPNLHEQALGRLVASDPLALGSLAQSSAEHPWWSRVLIQALWPALWGHAFKDLWPGNEEVVDGLGAWALLGLQPEGPFPPLRIADQPYGVLPISLPAAWQPLQSLIQVEAPLAGFVDACVDVAARAAEAGGTVQGASTEQLIDLLGLVPASPDMRVRSCAPMGVAALAVLFGGGDRVLDMIRGWEDVMQSARQLVERELGELGPRAQFVGLGDAAPLAIPLVPESDEALRDDVTRFFAALAENPEVLADNAALATAMGGALPENLLFRLVLRSIQLAGADIGRAAEGDPPPTMEREILGLRADDSKLDRWLLAFLRGGPVSPSPKAEVLRRCLVACNALRAIPVEHLDRLLRMALDCASHRIDAWATALASVRLQQLVASKATSVRRVLGCYGWVDAPRPGRAGPTEAGLLLCPSDHHARTAAALRDRALSSEDASWDMALRSDAVRAADRLAVAVREGIHPAEHLGREIERMVPPFEVERLRREYPLRAEHEGHRACDGRAILDAAPDTLRLGPEALQGIEALRRAVDTYGDLLLAEAAHRVVEGRADRAGSALDAAAGLAPPPELEILRHRPSARTVETACLSILPAVEEHPLPIDASARARLSPMSIAEPSLAAYLDNELDADEWVWSFTIEGVRRDVRLTELGLTPSDSLAFSTDELTSIIQRFADPEGQGRRLDDRHVTGPSRHASAARFVASLGHRPAAFDDLSIDATRIEPGTAFGDVDTDTTRLLSRLDRLTPIADALIAELESAASDAAWSLPEINARLTSARRWAVPVPSGRSDEEARELARRASAHLRERVALLPPAADRSRLGANDLQKALRALVAPSGTLQIFETFTLDELPALAPGASLQEDWLNVVAAVRPHLAKLEAALLEATLGESEAPPTQLWSNRNDDPWQQNRADTRRMIAALAPRSLDLRTLASDASVAIAAVDRFAEEVPEPRHTVSASFGFHAPTSRAPQALLVAVPPNPSKPIVEDDLLGFVQEARRLTRARGARPGVGALGEMAGAIPVGMVPANGPMGVHLEPEEST
jgi:hypothetical protein